MELVLGVPIAQLRTETELQQFLDNLDEARDLTIKERADATDALGKVQKRMRGIQARYVGNLKPTQAERSYKADDEHSSMEELAASLDAVIRYCDAIHEVLRDKYFRTINKLKTA